MNLTLPTFSPNNQIKLILIGCALFSLIYFGFGHYPLRSTQVAPVMVWDNYIPLIPWTVAIYLSQYFFLTLGVVYAPTSSLSTRTYYGYLFTTLIAGSIFAIFPTELPRIDFNEHALNIVTYSLYQFLYLTDVPNNCFPSLHSSLALMAQASLSLRGKRWCLVARIWCIAILISTLTTKQHCILDIAAGMLLFVICNWLLQKIIVEKN
jgi:membrane-associated phospholipid phosphatase